MDFVAIDTGISGDKIAHLLAERMRIRIAEAVGILALLYAGMALHAEDGDLSDTLDSQIEEWCKWHGKRGKLAPLLRSQLCDEQGVVRAWERWNGAMIRKARADRDRKRAARAAAAESPSRPRTVHGQSAPVPRSGAGTVPDLTVPTTTTRDSAAPIAPDESALTQKLVHTKPNWPAKVAECWTRCIGVIQPGRVGKDLAPFVRLYPTPEDGGEVAALAVEKFAASRDRNLEAGKEDRRGWPHFVREILDYVPGDRMPPRKAA